MKDIQALERFGLLNGDFFSDSRYTNLWWYLGDKKIGYGDLRSKDIFRIQERLVEGEVFRGYNQHHGSRMQQQENEVIRITSDDIVTPERERVTDETRRKNWLENR